MAGYEIVGLESGRKDFVYVDDVAKKVILTDSEEEAEKFNPLNLEEISDSNWNVACELIRDTMDKVSGNNDQDEVNKLMSMR